MWSLALILFFSFSSFAGLQKLDVKNLNLNYSNPYGQGDFEKINVGVSLKEATYSAEIFRRDNSFEIISPFANFEWHEPIRFIHNIQKLSTSNFNLSMGKLKHELEGTSLTFVEEKGRELSFEQFKINCQGGSSAKEVVDRLKADCREKMEATISHMLLPFDFITIIADQLPEVPAETDQDLPAHDFYLNMAKGDFYSFVRVKYVVKAYLRVWGHMDFEDEGKTLAIKVSSIKYGVLPVTTLVMGELARRLKHPRIEITPPWIRIKLGNK